VRALEGRRILVVDDEAGLREILTEEFVYHGAVVTGVDGGDVAFELLRRETFDAVITDVIMKDGDGPSLIKRLDELPGPRPKLFLCTGFSHLSREQVRDLNVAAVFEKPFERDHLIETMQRALNERRPGETKS